MGTQECALIHFYVECIVGMYVILSMGSWYSLPVNDVNDKTMLRNTNHLFTMFMIGILVLIRVKPTLLQIVCEFMLNSSVI